MKKVIVATLLLLSTSAFVRADLATAASHAEKREAVETLINKLQAALDQAKANLEEHKTEVAKPEAPKAAALDLNRILGAGMQALGGILG